MPRLHLPTAIPLVVAIGALTACADAPTASRPVPAATAIAGPPQFPGTVTGGSIAFTTTRHGIPELYVVNPGGQHAIRLTTSGAEVEWNQQPDWSPDGTKLLFTRRATVPGVGLVHDVHVLDLTQPNPQPQRFIDNPGASGSPAWSPDGSKVAYCSFNIGPAEIWIFDVASGTAQPLGAGRSCWPDWSPDGTAIAYHTVGANPEIAVMDLATQTVHSPAPGASRDVFPEWSPDGKQLVFQSNRDRDAAGTPYFALYTVPADGSAPPTNITPIPDGLTASQWSHDIPTWSLNDAKVVVGALRPGTEGTFQLFEINVNSGHAEQLTSGPGHNFLPSVRRMSRLPVRDGLAVTRSDHGGGIPQGDTLVSARDGNREI